MREELARQHKENGKIRKNCESQRKAMQLQRAAVKLQQETADAWRTLELSLPCRVKAKLLKGFKVTGSFAASTAE